MTNPITAAYRILAHFWLEEIRAADVDTIASLPELALALPSRDAADLTDLAVEYQRLFGFNLPPYESVFIDPSTMLLAPATQRLQTLYRQAGWQPPASFRTGAPDHVGLELLALADWLDAGQMEPANQLHSRHLALWIPPFVLALTRLSPHPFYQTLADLTLDLVLTTLPDNPLPPNSDPFPLLPPPPIYETAQIPSAELDSHIKPQAADSPDEADTVNLRDVVKALLPPCQAGLFITREDIARLGQSFGAPAVMGERQRMFDSLFRFAGQYDLVLELLDGLKRLLTETGVVYRDWAKEYPAWGIYAAAWKNRLEATGIMIGELEDLAETQG